MITKVTNGRVLIDGEFVHTDIYIEGTKILAVGGSYKADHIIDGEGAYVTAGFIDLHCHGGGGADFADGEVEGVKKAALVHLMHGTTTVFPTIVSTDFEVLERAIQSVEKAREDLPMLAGIHLEGPYFSPNQMGAQNAGALRKPNPSEYEQLLTKYPIARWDYAPELDEEFTFLEALQTHHVIAAAAHTDATCRQMCEAANKGCQLVTHLYSCTSSIRREAGFRIAGVVEATYLTDEICAELIADGAHLPNELLLLAYKLKGPGRLALVTDAMRAAGLDGEGEFVIGGVPCIVEDGVAKLLDRSAFAGSIATADRLVRTCVKAGIPLADAIRMITETPAELMGLTQKGKIKAGCDADLVLFDDAINIKSVILQGEVIQ